MNQFVGREEELAKLKSIWREVKNGTPQVVNYIADTGLGKTRLIQAFYEWLSTEPEENGGTKQLYWPNDLGAGRQRVVNPSLERFVDSFDLKNNRIPWLWWGMYWTDATNDVRNALIDNSAFLDAHLNILEINANCDRHAIETMQDVILDHGIDILKDAAKELLEHFASSGHSLAVDVGVSVFKVAKAVFFDNQKRRKAIALAHGQREQNHLEVLASELLLRLQKLFDRKSKVPMVLFLDDIHFAADISHDDKTLEFLDRILRQAASNKWPLLVITTHWKSPWQDHLKVKSVIGNSWRRIEEALKADLAVKDKLKFNDVELTKMPDGDLRKIALNYLPGLSEENLQIILGKVDNVRWLVELLKALSDCGENFENRQRTQSLSAIGLSRLDKLLTHQGYLDVIRDRLQGDEMSDIRAVLGATAWHTYGLEFVTHLAEAFEQRLIEQKYLAEGDEEMGQRVLGALMHAMDPATLIDGDSFKGRLSNLIWFPERGYLEVARELFDETQVNDLTLVLGKRILEWMQPVGGNLPRWQQLESLKEQKVFLGIAIEVLGKLQPRLSADQEVLLKSKAEFLRELVKDGTISEESYDMKYQQSRDDLLEKSTNSCLDGASQFQVLALAEMTNLAWVDADPLAAELALKLLHHDGLLMAEELIPVEAMRTLEYIWNSSKQISQLVLMTHTDGGSGRIYENKAAILHKEAEIYFSTGITAKARQLYLECLELLNLQTNQSGNTEDLLERRAFVMQRLAEVDIKEERFGEAYTKLENLLAIWEMFLTEFGETPERLRTQTIVKLRLADLDRGNGWVEKSWQAYKDSLTVWDRILTQYGETPERLEDKRITLDRLAIIESEMGS